MSELFEQINSEEPKKSRRTVFVILGVATIFLVVSCAVVVQKIDASYANRVYPGIHIGDVHIGGMQQQELEKFLTDMNDKLSLEGLHFTLKNGEQEKKFTIFPNVSTENTERQLMHVDAHKESLYLVNLGKGGTFFTRMYTYFKSSRMQPHLALKFISLDESGVMNALQEQIEVTVEEPKNANIAVESYKPVQLKLVSAVPGLGYNFSSIKNDLIHSWSVLKVPDLTFVTEVKPPFVQDQAVDIAVATKQAEIVFAASPFVVAYTDVSGTETTWKISNDTLQKLLGVQSDSDKGVHIGLKTEETKKYIEDTFSSDVNIEAQDARFLVDASGKVKEFEAAHEGITVDVEKTYDALNTLVSSIGLQEITTTSTVALAVQVAKPEIQTADVNNLGITSVLGVGVSNFKGSPSNRVKNIKNAVEKLNGMLIKPGEEFSAIAATQPYTLEAGYFPEKVIKGDKITPEIGGGLCQVGTTLFRMAMNSGMEITERRNHSLVVNYYNDLTNGKPGTDATIYEPSPDFKFKNDTNNYVLIQTSVNVEKGDLKFTLWGTSDGRKGSYTAPTVLRWIPTGPTRTIQSSSLKPGEKECQHAFPGADTSFIYTRQMSDGTKQDTVFESHYRPLPEICLVGGEAAPVAPVCPPGQDCTIPLSDLTVPVVAPAAATVN